jgi:hypothetical protein
VTSPLPFGTLQRCFGTAPGDVGLAAPHMSAVLAPIDDLHVGTIAGLLGQLAGSNVDGDPLHPAERCLIWELDNG